MQVTSVAAVLAVLLATSHARRNLPKGGVIAGYTNQANATTILRSVDQGVNVLFWSFIELRHGNGELR